MKYETDRNGRHSQAVSAPHAMSDGLSPDIEAMISQWVVPLMVEDFLRKWDSAHEKAEAA